MSTILNMGTLIITGGNISGSSSLGYVEFSTILNIGTLENNGGNISLEVGYAAIRMDLGNFKMSSGSVTTISGQFGIEIIARNNDYNGRNNYF